MFNIKNEYKGLEDTVPFTQRSGNFFYGNYLFLLDELEEEKTYYAIADLAKYVNDTENHAKELNILINSCGGSVMLMNTIIGLINIAKLRGLEVNTYVFGMAASAASVIAVTGTHRVMSRNALHFVHFGTIPQFLTKVTEIPKSSKFVTRLQQQAEEIYLNNCENLSKEKYLNLIEDEMGYIFADECLKLGFCDEVVEDKLDEVMVEANKQIEYFKKAQELMDKDSNKKKTTKKSK